MHGEKTNSVIPGTFLNQFNHCMGVTSTFRRVNLNFGGGGFPCRIYSSQIHLLYSPRKLESTIIPHCGAQLFLCTRHFLQGDDIRYIFAVGMELF